MTIVHLQAASAFDLENLQATFNRLENQRNFTVLSERATPEHVSDQLVAKIATPLSVTDIISHFANTTGVEVKAEKDILIVIAPSSGSAPTRSHP